MPSDTKKVKEVKEKSTIIKKYVWFYFEQGFSIIPLGKNKGVWHNSKDELKKPSIQSWDKYKNTKATKEEIQQWLDDGLFKNIGIICGHVSNDLVIIDIDDETIPELLKLKFDKILENGSWPVKTGKGYQILMKHHSNPGGIKKPLKYKIEYRANNGYCVAPPSTHPNGKNYYFIGIKDLKELPKLKSNDVKSIFEDFKKRIGKIWDIKEKKHTYAGVIETTPPDEYPKCVAIALETTIKHPMRYNIIYGIASSFAMQNIPKDMAIKRIKQFNMEKCVPPKATSDVENAINGAYEKNSKKYGCEFWMDDAEMCPYENTMECPYGKKKAKRELAKKYKIFDYDERKNKETGEQYFIKKDVRPPKLAELILNEYEFNFVTLRDTKEIYYYNDGAYHPDGELIIRQIAEEFMENITKTHHKNEVVDYIKDKNYQKRNEFFISKPNLINVKNGILNLETKELLPHTPQHHFLNETPVEYNPNAKCPKIIKFFSEVVYEHDISVLQEFAGYCLYKKYHIHKAAMFLGGGKNGKSTAINLLIALLGKDNVSNKELQEIIYNRFATSSLYGKLLNASADISSKSLSRTGKFKELTGGDYVEAEAKFKDSFSFTNYAKFLFSANALPKASDDSYAFYRRWILISFPNTFTGKMCDPNLLEKLTTQEELSGFLNWAVEGLQRLLKNGDFSYGKTVEDVMEQYKTLSDPIYAYCTEFLKCQTGGHIIKANLYKHYVKWCKEKQLPIIPKNILTGELAKHLPEIKTGKVGGKGNQTPAYLDIDWKTEDISNRIDEKIDDGKKQRELKVSTLQGKAEPFIDTHIEYDYPKNKKITKPKEFREWFKHLRHNWEETIDDVFMERNNDEYDQEAWQKLLQSGLVEKDGDGEYRFID